MADRSVKTQWKAPGTFAEDAGPLREFGVARLQGARLTLTDPAVSQAQQAFMGAELRRKRAGKRTRTGLSEAQLAEFAATPRKGLPARARKRKQ